MGCADQLRRQRISHQNIVQFAADVETATGGSLKIAVHPGGTMIKHAEIKRAVSDGKAAAGEVLISLAADEAPVYGVDLIPFLATGYDGARKLYDAQRPFLEKQLAKKDWCFCSLCPGRLRASTLNAKSSRSMISKG